MKKYERTNLKITRFSKEDVIATSTYDKNNAYTAIWTRKPGSGPSPDNGTTIRNTTNKRRHTMWRRCSSANNRRAKARRLFRPIKL